MTALLSPRALVLRYAAFAAVATLANLAAQRLVLLFGPTDLWLAPAIAVGTGVGLVVKYLLDKRWIFFDRSAGAAAHGRRFGLYTLTGVVTTLIFWGAEAGAWAIWHDQTMREIGALAGLACGYVLKYRLDRRFVFRAIVV
ncbi:GtrA family protein [Limimaricola sp.]|uniref:GtrA family protein n=1 Tax=Limimaricola sp. TaxID=2211665 RepID=UPI0025C55A5A|nr:GtrA family protein [Limimaricola sp.]